MGILDIIKKWWVTLLPVPDLELDSIASLRFRLGHWEGLKCVNRWKGCIHKSPCVNSGWSAGRATEGKECLLTL